MGKTQLKKDFLFHLELFFRNFGNEWTLNDFPKHFNPHHKMLTEYLLELEKLGIVELKEHGRFVIKELPSKVI
jgi:hypothetical protein